MSQLDCSRWEQRSMRPGWHEAPQEYTSRCNLLPRLLGLFIPAHPQAFGWQPNSRSDCTVGLGFAEYVRRTRPSRSQRDERIGSGRPIIPSDCWIVWIGSQGPSIHRHQHCPRSLELLHRARGTFALPTGKTSLHAHEPANLPAGVGLMKRAADMSAV